MKLGEGETSIANYPAVAPTGRGVQATLSSHRLVWLQGTQEEHYPLEKITGVSQGYERRTGRVIWGAVLLVFALALGIALQAAPSQLPKLLDTTVQTLTDRENPERIASARRTYQQRLDFLLLALLPLWGVVGAAGLYGLWLGYTGIRGETRVQITLLAITRTLQQRGHDPQLLEFGEKVAQRAAGLRSRASAMPAVDQNLVDWIPTKLS